MSASESESLPVYFIWLGIEGYFRFNALNNQHKLKNK